MHESILNNLFLYSFKLGSNPDFVQASGGNISFKKDDLIWVKATGKKLKCAQIENIFIPLDLNRLTGMDILEIEKFNDFSSSQFHKDLNLVPSLETNFHLYFASPIVIHLHSLGAVALSVLKSLREDIQIDFYGRRIYSVPYAKPGRELANRISQICPKNAEIVLLQNHGVIFCGNDFAKLVEMILSFESKVLELIQNESNSKNRISITEILSEGYFTPDQAVFMGQNCLETYTNAINGKIQNEDIREVALFYGRVAALVSGFDCISYLSSNEVEDLVNWDREILRKEMSK